MSQPSEEPDFSVVTTAADAAQSSDLLTPAQVQELASRVAALEGLQEEAARRPLADAELTGYISELRAELKDIKTLRSIYGFVAVGLIAFLISMLLALVFVSGSPLYSLPSYPASVLVISLVAGLVILTLTLARSVHRSSVDQARDDPTPQVPNMLLEIFKQMKH